MFWVRAGSGHRPRVLSIEGRSSLYCVGRFHKRSKGDSATTSCLKLYQAIWERNIFFRRVVQNGSSDVERP